MKKYRCVKKILGGPKKGEIYSSDFTWGSKDYTVEELANKCPEDWELVSEEHYYCSKCKGYTYDSYCCGNPECPNMPCCGNPKELCNCKEDSTEEPEYVPFTFEDRDQFRDRWIMNKEFGFEYKIIGIVDNTIKITGYSCTYEQAFKEFTFSDGTPFGKLKE